MNLTIPREGLLANCVVVQDVESRCLVLVMYLFPAEINLNKYEVQQTKCNVKVKIWCG